MSQRHILLASYSGRFAGTEHLMLAEAGYLNSVGARVTAATRNFAERQEFEAALASLGVSLRHFDPPPFLAEWKWRHWNRLRAYMTPTPWKSPEEFTAVSVFMPWLNRGLEHIWMASRAGLPVIVSVHNTFPANPFGTPWSSPFLREAFANVHGIYGVSHSALRNFQSAMKEFIRPDTIQKTIYNAVDTSRFVPSAGAGDALRDRLNLPADRRIVGSVGRLSDHKRPVELIDVFRRIHEQDPDVHFVLVGDGELRPDVEKAIDEAGLTEAVTLMGQQPDVAAILAGLDVHVLLSKIEGFGLVTAEAMSCAIPVVATKVPGSEEVLEDGVCGTFVPLGDEAAAADAVLAILRDPARQEAFGAAGRRRAIALFDSKRRAKEILGLYDDVLAIHAARTGVSA